MKIIKNSIKLSLILLLGNVCTYATTWETIDKGYWTDTAVWLNGAVPDTMSGDTFVINHPIVISQDLIFTSRAYILITQNGGICGHQKGTLLNSAKLITYGILELDDLVIDNVVGNAQEGYSIKAGDIVTIETIPDEGTEACFRADRLLGVFRTSDTETSIHFKASNGTDADDYIVLTHPDNDGAEFKLIANYINEACNANFNKRGDVITVWDKQNNIVGRGLNDAGVTNMVITID